MWCTDVCIVVEAFNEMNPVTFTHTQLFRLYYIIVFVQSILSVGTTTCGCRGTYSHIIIMEVIRNNIEILHFYYYYSIFFLLDSL